MHHLAGFDLTGCDYRGRVFDMLEGDRWVEDRFFRGWRNDLAPAVGRWGKSSTASLFSLVDEEGVPALEWSMNMPALLVAGDETWGDLEVSADVRCIMTRAFPTFHDEMTHDFEGRTGVAFRLQDSRRHGFAGFQNGNRLVTAVRDDGNWIVLNEMDYAVDPHRWYRVTARCVGDRIEVSVDGEHLLTARDDRWTTGGGGVYANTVARFRNAAIVCADAAAEAVEQRAATRAKALKKLRGETPQPVKLEEIIIPHPDGDAPRVSTVTPHRDDFVADWQAHERRGLLRFTRAGDVLWQRELNMGDAPIGLDMHDIDLDGADEIVALDGAAMHVLDAATGRTKHEAPYPDGCPFLTLRGRRAKFYARCPKLWHTAGDDRPARVVLFAATGGGGHTVWSYDHELKHRWTHHNYAGKTGHDIASWDIDGDGRREIVLGYYVLDDDGNVVWRVRDQDLIFKQDHTDNLYCGPWDAAGEGAPKIIASCGEAGYIVFDARDGAIIRQQRHIGHVQRICAGRFRHDLGGVQAWVGTDWGSPGIFMLVDERGEVLHRCQPDALNTGAAAVTWWPDGRQLLMMNASPRSAGLWDAWGRRVVDFNDTPLLDNTCSLCHTGQAPRHGLSVVRVPGMATDVLLVNDGETLHLFGPDSQ